MPKMKTHSSAKKRFRVTATGRVRRPKAGKVHKMIGKRKSRLRKLEKNTMVDAANVAGIKRLLACGG